MTSLLARSFVVVVAMTGFAASTSVTKATPTKGRGTPVVVGTVGSPPLCMPHDPTYCGLD